MNCPTCQHENIAGAKFCQECGVPLGRNCVNCGSEVASTSRFCSQCGHRLQTADDSRFASPQNYTPRHFVNKILASRRDLEGERKHVTVLFADIRGSMELLVGRDAETAEKLLFEPVLECMIEAVYRYEGTVHRVMGDGIMALFGAPLAVEDHAVRACYAGLRMQETVALCSRDTAFSWSATGDPGRSQLGRNLHPHNRQRSRHGLHRRGPDGAPSKPHGTDG